MLHGMSHKESKVALQTVWPGVSSNGMRKCNEKHDPQVPVYSILNPQ